MVKTLLKSIREYKLPSLLSPLFMVGEVAMEVLIPTVMAGLIDQGVKQSSMQSVLLQGLLLVLCMGWPAGGMVLLVVFGEHPVLLLLLAALLAAVPVWAWAERRKW